MSRWISGEELMRRWDCTAAELYYWGICGSHKLIPYGRNGWPLEPKYIKNIGWTVTETKDPVKQAELIKDYCLGLSWYIAMTPRHPNDQDQLVEPRDIFSGAQYLVADVERTEAMPDFPGSKPTQERADLDDSVENLREDVAVDKSTAKTRNTTYSLHSNRAQAYADSFWKKNPYATNAQVVNHIRSRTEDPFEGKCYTDSAIKRMIRCVHTGTPGRKPKK